MERGNKVIDESVTEWLELLKVSSDQLENFVKYAVEQGATSVWGGRNPTADFQNGWVVTTSMAHPGNGGSPYVRYVSWRTEAFDDTHKTALNDWRAAVDRAVSGGIHE